MPQETPPYRAGIVGTGFMGTVHSRAVRASGGEVVGVVGSRPDRGREAAEALGTRAYDDVDALLDDSTITVVHVCTPNHLHARVARAAIERGKHVVCEKPLATSLADASAMTAEALGAGVVATVPFVYRFHPMVREARARIRAGELGRLTLAHGGYFQDWLARPSDGSWRLDPRLGGATRAFGDIGSHWCDLFEFVTGTRITALSARMVTAIPERDSGPVATDDITTLSFEATGGVVGTAVMSQVSPGRKNRLVLEISGLDASLAFDQEDAERLWMGGVDANRVLLRDPSTASASAAPYSTLPAGHAQGYQECFTHLVADTAAAIAGAPVDGLPTFADGRRAAALAEAVVDSAASGGWVEVDAEGVAPETVGADPHEAVAT
jgi:predicted dehydrogenase